MNVTVTVRLQLIDCEIAIYCEITGIIQVKTNSDVRPRSVKIRKNSITLVLSGFLQYTVL